MKIFVLGLLYGWYACYTIDALREKMKNGKAVRQEWIPAEAWKAFGEQDIDVSREMARKCIYTYVYREGGLPKMREP